MPGDTFIYEFTATPAGSHMYHSHHDATDQVGRGLLGAFIVQPRDPAQRYDRLFGASQDIVWISNDTLGVNAGERWDAVIECRDPVLGIPLSCAATRQGPRWDVRDGHGPDRRAVTGLVMASASLPKSRRVVETVMLATDLSSASDDATAWAIRTAAAFRARLLVVNVLEHRRLNGFGSHDREDQARAEREAVLEELVSRARTGGAHCEYILWAGEPSSSIVSLAEAERADLIVVGTHGRARAGRLFLGSVSDHLVRSAPCPVMVVRPDHTERRVPTGTAVFR